MIFRITQKLAKKIDAEVSNNLPLDRNPFADWSSHLFTVQRVQHIIITNTSSLYSFVMYGRGITDKNQFIKWVVSAMREFMRVDENEFIYRRLIEPRIYQIMFSKALNRSVTGSMNELVKVARFFMMDDDMSPFDVSFRLNEIPMSQLKYMHPREAFMAMSID